MKFFYRTLVVYENQQALIYKNGHHVETVGAGKYHLWGWHRHSAVFDMRRRFVTIPCQEILSKDQIPIRITLAVGHQVVDPVKANHEVENYAQQLYLDVQLALREIVAELTFDELLDQKNKIGDGVQRQVTEAALAYGVRLERTAIKDVTMPGNIREMMLKTVEAEKSAQASLIKAREEVAAARARANAARMMSENPAVLRLKELETLTDLAKSPGNTVIFAGSTDVSGLLATAANGSAKPAK